MIKTYDEQQLLSTAKKTQFLSVTIVDHPLVRNSLMIMRDKTTSMADFRSAVHRLTPHLVYAATQGLTEKNIQISTPLANHVGRSIAAKIVLIPVLRSGIGMYEPTQLIFPNATTIFAFSFGITILKISHIFRMVRAWSF